MPGAENLLNKGGLYLDDLTRKLRLLHPDVHQLSQEITNECAEYGECKSAVLFSISKVKSFQRTGI